LKYELLSRENFMRYNTFMPENNKESIFVVKIMASEKPDYWNSIGGMYSYAGQQGWGEMYASAKYMDLLNEQGRNDWRPDKKKIVDARANFISPSYITDSDGKYVEVFRFIKNVYNKNNIHTGYTYVQLPISKRGNTVTCKEGETNYTLSLINSSEEKYSINYSDGQTYSGVIDYEIELSSGQPKFYILKCSNEGTASGEAESQLHSPVISRLGEVYLNRAEAYAKKGDYSHAQADLNIIRERSLPGRGYNDLNASNAKVRIEKERQLELAYQAERSYDVFRNCETLTRKYPGVHDAMLEIPATDYRVIYFIPQSAINSYPGTLTQNPTSN
ncbi:RagB/SusD family nutrient uptake outer membrane protein, partial [Bacteroides fragilis]